ncbi:hypothetical protein BKA61DRAFT_731284 [Leptodontidium sp. MPI-SDFR-AT-0119]|nr:hypothetical protein BKA61DRAFT_731284 [Leptodontidium sp. MPI-SDFR-AT-0119]
MSYRLSNHELPQAESIAALEVIDEEMEHPIAYPGRVNDEESGGDDSDSSYGRSDSPVASLEILVPVVLPFELRRMVIKFSLPRAAVIQLKHETYQYKSRGHQERYVRMIVDTTNNFTIKQLRESRGLALLRVNNEFRDIYINALPLSLHICHVRIQSKLRFSNEDLLFCSTFFGRIIAVNRTFDALIRQNIFKDVTHVAFQRRRYASTQELPFSLDEALQDFPPPGRVEGSKCSGLFPYGYVYSIWPYWLPHKSDSTFFLAPSILVFGHEQLPL